MAKPGPKARPALAVVREGNPGKRPVREGVTLPPSKVTEPDWRVIFPSVGADGGTAPAALAQLRRIAHKEWTRVAPVLAVSVGLREVDTTLLTDYVICVARIDQGERALTRDGVLMLSERGWVKNGWTTILAAYRSQLRGLIGELGLSPAARSSLKPPEGSDGDDPFDP
jgi:P27 family predicted phage terminase small subunit